MLLSKTITPLLHRARVQRANLPGASRRRTAGGEMGALEPASTLLLLTAASWLLPLLGPAVQGSPVEEEEELVLPTLERSPDSGITRLHLDAFGLQLRLELQLDLGFLAPGFKLQTVGRRPGSNVSDVDLAGDLRRCFYSGTVNGDPNSAAALSLCEGVRGAFFLLGDEYSIQPAPAAASVRLVPATGTTTTTATPEERPRFHLLRRKRLDGGGAKCGVVDEEIELRGTAQQKGQDPKIRWAPRNRAPAHAGQATGIGRTRVDSDSLSPYSGPVSNPLCGLCACHGTWAQCSGHTLDGV